MSFTIMTDSCCDLPYSFINKNGVEVVSLVIEMDGVEHIDDLGKTFSKEEFFENIKNGKTATTSQINIGTYEQIFKKYIQKGEPLLYLAFSSGLSGSYNNALTALEMLNEQYDETNITIIDTLAASLGEGLLVYEAILKKNNGSSLEEIADWIESNKMKLHSWVTVDDIKHLERGGRISATSAAIGTLLNVKPIIIMNKEGSLIPVAKIRGRKRSLNYLVDKTVEGIISPEEQTIFIGHAGVPEEAEKVKKALADKLDFLSIQIYPYGPTIASHTGFGSLSIFSFGRER